MLGSLENININERQQRTEYYSLKCFSDGETHLRLKLYVKDEENLPPSAPETEPCVVSWVLKSGAPTVCKLGQWLCRFLSRKGLLMEPHAFAERSSANRQIW